MDSHKNMNVNKFRIPTTKHFLKGGKCETFQGLTLWFIDGERSEMVNENKEVGAMPTCYWAHPLEPELPYAIKIFKKMKLTSE